MAYGTRHVSVTADASGDYTARMTISSASTSATHAITIHVVDRPTSISVGVDVMGDSLVAAATYSTTIRTDLGATLIGSQGVEPDVHDGRCGWTWLTYTIDATTPWLDIPAWEASLSAVPDVLIWMLGTNDAWSCSAVTHPLDCISDVVDRAEDLMAVVAAEYPSMIQGIALPPPGCTDPDSFTAVGFAPVNGVPAQEVYRARLDSLVYEWVRRNGDTSLLIPTNASISGHPDDGHYLVTNGNHPDDPGYEAMARVTAPWIVYQIEHA